MPQKASFSTVALQEQSKEFMKRAEQRFFAEVARSFDEFHNAGVAVRHSNAKQASPISVLHFRAASDPLKPRLIQDLSRPPHLTVDRSRVTVVNRAPYQAGGHPLEAQFSPRDDIRTSVSVTPSEYFSFAQSRPMDGVFDMYAQTFKDDPDIENNVFWMPTDPGWDPDLPDDYHHRFVTIPEVSRENGVQTKSVAAALFMPYIYNTSGYTNDRALATVSADVDLRSFFWFSSRTAWDFARARLEVRLVVRHGSDLHRDYLILERPDPMRPYSADQSLIDDVAKRHTLSVSFESPYFGNVDIAVHGQLMVQVPQDSAFGVGCSASSLNSEREGYFRVSIPEIRYMYSWPGLE